MARGFQLIELMIVMVMIGILSSICLPIYSQHILHAKRLTAEMQLLKIASALEKYYLINNTYQDATLVNLGLKDTVNHYQFRIAAATATDYSLVAIPLQEDTACATLLLNAAGEKNITGTSHADECWQ